jgi:hypothetical protein
LKAYHTPTKEISPRFKRKNITINRSEGTTELAGHEVAEIQAEKSFVLKGQRKMCKYIPPSFQDGFYFETTNPARCAGLISGVAL